MTNETRERVFPWLLLGLLSLIWGSSFILIKQGLEVYSPGEVGALRIVSAGLFLTPLALPKLKSLSRKHIGLLFVIGLVGSFIPAFLFALAQTRIASGVTGVLNATTPLFTLVLGALFFGIGIRTRSLLGILIGFVGVAILILTGSSSNVLDNFNAYALFVVLATVCYGINVNTIKKFASQFSSLTITGVSLALVMPIALVYLLGFTAFVPKLESTAGASLALFYIVLLGVLGTAIALIMFNRLVQIKTPVFAAQVTYLIPMVALVWGLAVDEKIYWGHVLGMVGILVGVYLANRR